MIKSLPVRWYLLKIIVSLISFLLALSFEDASRQRSVILIVLFALFIIWDYVRPTLKNRWPLFLLDGTIIFLMEYYSKFLVNYFFHLFYLGIILEAGFVFERWQANTVSAIIGITALSKFIYALIVMWNAMTVAEFLFNFFALAFIITLSNYAAVQRESRKEKDELYGELLEAYRKLRDYSEKVEEASALKERTRIAREIHDTLGHRIVSLIMQLEMVLRFIRSKDMEHNQDHSQNSGIDNNVEIKIREMVDRTLQEARAALADTRSAINALKGRESSGIDAVMELARNFEKNTSVKVDIKAQEIGLLPEQSVVLYRVVQEAITNAVKHGKATMVKVDIKEEGDKVIFDISDNGTGGEYKEGFGLENMKQRVEAIGGKLEVSGGEKFTIHGGFPVGRVV
ncbi:sensor histidine kinase [Biomaibacter acetigenes]|jgi:signal transduction histidine kinase|uniref:histidine kinase n=1 Tax=Biomaibacter acetigenes TaxID=2316383 RepID=A0A3G2R3X3_9FIRM|nr:sensor histidine kinase [Biomaibacter acetigenes]AYO30051.1 sensor histidine kinase [Biomaibacter acetigenes]